MLYSIKGLETMLNKFEIKTSSKDNKDYIMATFLSFAGGDSFNIMIKDMDMLSKLKNIFSKTSAKISSLFSSGDVEKIKEDISENEFKKAKNKIKVEFASETETVSAIGETIGYYMTVCEDLALAADYMKEVENITIDDLKDAAKRYLNIDNAVISVLMPEAE